MLYALSAHAQSFALLSPAVVTSLPSQIDTPPARAMLRDADASLALAPHPMPRLHTEGTLPHQGIRDQSIEAERDFPAAQSLAFAYRLTGDRKYLAQARNFLDAWASTYKPSGNPIDETPFGPLFVAFDLTRGDLPPETEQRTVDLFRKMSTIYLDWLDQNTANDKANNWSSHRVKLAVLGAYETGDGALIARAERAYTRQRRLNIHPDGSVMDFYMRDALHYVVYDLEPFTTAALAARAHGQDWFHTASTGAPSVELAVDWLVPFALGEKTHEEFVHSTVPFDAARDKAGEAGYSGQWQPKTSVNLLALATALDPKYAPTLDKVEVNTSSRTPVWIALAIQANAWQAGIVQNNAVQSRVTKDK
jgi:hypothetical protein